MNYSQRHYDPTDEARGWHKYPKPNRRLRRFGHIQENRNRTVALTKMTTVTYGKNVKIRNRELLADITVYLAIADRVGLDVANVAKLYRYRRDNGYVVPTAVEITNNSTFRGGDH